MILFYIKLMGYCYDKFCEHLLPYTGLIFKTLFFFFFAMRTLRIYSVDNFHR